MKLQLCCTSLQLETSSSRLHHLPLLKQTQIYWWATLNANICLCRNTCFFPTSLLIGFLEGWAVQWTRLQKINVRCCSTKESELQQLYRHLFVYLHINVCALKQQLEQPEHNIQKIQIFDVVEQTLNILIKRRNN